MVHGWTVMAVLGLVGCQQKTPTAPASIPGKPVNWGQGYGTQAPTMGGAAPALPANLAPTVDPWSGGDAVAGKQAFGNTCAVCHKLDGKGGNVAGTGLVANLARAELQALTDSALADVIVHGRNKMPAFGTQLQASQVRDVIAYIRTLKE